ncbi:Protein FAR1-RELATED SEQUENCE 7 [Bienertia sinuspersici]
MKFDTLQQGITFYENYAKISGFDTRLSSTKKRKTDGKILVKYYVCSKKGFREHQDFMQSAKRKDQ